MKRIVSLLMILVLALTLLPAAFAEAAEGFDLRLAADTAGEGWRWEQATLTLTLDGAELQSVNKPVFRLPDGATLEVKGDSRLTATKTETPTNATFYALQADGALTLTGAGTLTVESESGGILSEGLTLGGKLALKTAAYGVNSSADLAVRAPLQVTLNGQEDKPDEAIALFCQEKITLEADVTVSASNAACGIKGKTVTVGGDAVVDVTNENQLGSDILAGGGIYSVNAIAGAEGITLTGAPQVTAYVYAESAAECVMAGQSYESSSSVGDLVIEGGTLKAEAKSVETAAFGVGGIQVLLKGGTLESKATGTEREDRISAAVVAGRYGGVSVGEGMRIATPEGGYISSDGRTVVNVAGETASEVTVSVGNGGVFRDTVSSGLEWICLGICLAVLAAVAVAAFLQRKKEQEK